jgi:hypothetical protein
MKNNHCKMNNINLTKYEAKKLKEIFINLNMDIPKEVEAALKEKKQYNVSILRREYEEVTREHDPEDEWDADDFYHIHEIEAFEVDPSGMGDFTVSEFPTGTWHLVCVFYSTGDSFHCEENCLSMVAFVKNKIDAEIIVNAINDDYNQYVKKGEWKYEPLKVHLPVSNIDTEIYSGTWKGYFESLNSVDIKELNTQEKITIPLNPRKRQYKRKSK